MALHSDPSGPAPFDLEESIHRIGRYAWIEMRLFEVVGGWVATVDEPALRVRFSAESHHFAWHGELWTQQLPELHGRDPHDLIQPPGPAAESFLDALADGDDARALEKAVGLYRVALPRLVSVYTRHLHRTAAVSDGPVRRWLRIVIDDHLADWRDGEDLVQVLAGTEADVERAGVQQLRLEAMLVRAGGIVP